MTYKIMQGDNRLTLKSLFDRFHKKYIIDKNTNCWNWVGSKDREGYGVLWDNRVKNNARAHRISLELNNIPVPRHLQVLHQCDNKSCVNPSHLRTGTNTENIQEAKDRGLLKHMSDKRKKFITKLTDEEFEQWKLKFKDRTGKELSNLTTAINWRKQNGL